MTDKEKLEIYDQLREMHGILKKIPPIEDSDWEANAIDAVDSVLYLAESVFARMDD